MGTTTSLHTKRSIAGLIIGLVICAIGALALVLGWGAHVHDLDIQEHGGVATGRITGKDFSAPDDWSVAYTFPLPDGSQYAVRTRSISRARWNTLQVGAAIEIRYAPDQPSRNFPVGEGGTPLAPVLAVSLLGLLCVGFGALLSVRSLGKTGPRVESGAADEGRSAYRNRLAAFAWGFAAIMLLFSLAMTHALWRDGLPPDISPPLFAAAVVALWLFTIAIVSHCLGMPCVSVALVDDRVLRVVRRFPFRREERLVPCVEVKPARVQVSRDEGEPYFRVRAVLGDGLHVDLYEGRDRERAAAVCARFNRMLGVGAEAG